MNLGRILGTVVSVAVIGGLVATPLYLRELQVDDRGLDQDLRLELENVRRAILNVEHELLAWADYQTALGADGRSDAQGRVDDSGQGRIAVAPEILKALEQTAQALRDAETADTGRGTQIAGPLRIAGGSPNPRASFSELQGRYLRENQKLLSDAADAARRLRSIARGEKLATSHVGVNRLQAILDLVRGRLHAQRAEFQRIRLEEVAGDCRRRLAMLAALQATAAALGLEEHAAVRSAVAKRESDLQMNAEQTREDLAVLDARIADIESQIRDLTAKLNEARRSIAAMVGPEGAPPSDRLRYVELEQEVRRAEARIAALRDGTLEGGQAVTTELDPSVPTGYRGGDVRPGLRDLRHKRALLASQLDDLTTMKADVDRQKKALAEDAARLEARRGELAGQIEVQQQEVSSLRERMGKLVQGITRSVKDALSSFDVAGAAATQAARLANARASEARTAAVASGGEPDERLTRIANDAETEASLQCLVAESYHCAALARWTQLQALALAGGAGVEVPAGEQDRPVTDAARLREDVVKAADVAARSYQKAAELLERVSLPSPEGTISGKNYVWQVHVSLASLCMFQAVLEPVGSEQRIALKDRAYKLLTDAVKGRERSEQLAAAVDAILHLQKHPD